MEENLFQNNEGGYNTLISSKKARSEGLAKDLEHHKREFKEFKLETKEDIKRVRSQSKNIIITVVVAALFIFILLAIEIMIFHTRDQSIGDEYRQKIDTIEAQIITNQNEK